MNVSMRICFQIRGVNLGDSVGAGTKVSNEFRAVGHVYITLTFCVNLALRIRCFLHGCFVV